MTAQQTDGSQASGARMYAEMIAQASGRPDLITYAYAADKQAVGLLMSKFPSIAQACASNRGFLGRATRRMAQEGIDQFLDIGCGLPVFPNVHDIAREIHPDAGVVYVDNDPAVVAYNDAMVDGEGVTTVHADLRDPLGILNDQMVRETLDFDRPVGLILVGILTFVENGVQELMESFRKILAPGSYLALSHACYDNIPEEERKIAEAVYRQTANPVFPRTRDEILRMFDGFELLDPGIVLAADWHPDPNDPYAACRSYEVVAGLAKLLPR
uniref:SAM-dependent methyltransferase n=1 Tax=Streptosporangium sp. CA-235898 TaxID=3240073 RepID=UPI003F497940